MTAKEGDVEIFGEIHHISYKGEDAPPYCLDCYAKTAIRCAWCGGTIVPDGPITLYSPGKVL